MKIKFNSCLGFYIIDLVEEHNLIKRINNFNILDSRNILKTCLNKNYYNVIPFIERVEFTSANNYSLCFIKAIEEIQKIKVKDNVNIIRVILLEFQNIYSNLIGLLNLYKISKDLILINLTNIIIDSLLNYFELISGHRIYHNMNNIAGFNQNFSIGNFEKTKNLIKDLYKKLNYLFELSIKIPSIKTKLEFLSVNKNPKINDLRKVEPYFFYKDNTILSIIEKNHTTTSCSYKRYLESIDSIKKSLSILEYLTKESTTYSLNELTNYSTQINTSYASSIQTSRGILSIEFVTDSDNKIIELKVSDPSSELFKQMIGNLENIIVDYTNLAVQSYFISFMELAK